MTPTVICSLFALVFGMVVGSFLNVCICRLPKNESIVTPPSHCPRCSYQIRWYDNIPLLSYLMLRGKCRGCGVHISLQYPLVELLNGVLALFLFLHVGPTPAFVVLFLFCSALVVITFIDIEHQIIPNEISGPGIAIGYACSLGFSGYSVPGTYIGLFGGGACLFLAFGKLLIAWKNSSGDDHNQDEAFDIKPYLHLIVMSIPGVVLALWARTAYPGQFWTSSLFGAFLGADLICAVVVAWYAIKKQEGMGGGDIKLLAMMGAFLGWQAVPFIIFAGSLLGSLIGVAIMLIQKKDSKLAIPFGPYLALGAVLYVFYGKPLIRWYLGLSGFYQG